MANRSAFGLGAFTDAARNLSSTPLQIFALFIVLVYGISTMALIFRTELVQQLVWFVCIFPFAILIAFVWLIGERSEQVASLSGRQPLPEAAGGTKRPKHSPQAAGGPKTRKSRSALASVPQSQEQIG